MCKAFLLASAGLSILAVPAWAADSPHDLSEVVVTGAPYVVSMDSTTTSVEVLKRDDLDAAPAGGLGDVLSGLPGVRSTFFGPGASRPVIRGLAGPRVMVLTNGVGMIDASALSPDHQVATDPQEAERIEVLRGPSALAYGGSAIGGVVNIIDDRIPELPADGLHGRLSASASSVDDGRVAATALHLGVGPWVLSLDGTHKESGDYDIPVAAKSARLSAIEGDPPPPPGSSSVVNTAVDLDAYGAGLSYVGERGFAGLAVKRTETTYGVPSEEAEPVTIALRQTRVDARGALEGDFGPFEKIRVSGGYADYQHVELEGGVPGTKFLSDGWEGRLEFVQPNRDGWQGAVGLQGLVRNFDAIGEEALVPRTRISEAGAFALQRLDKGAWGLEGGLRIDSRKLDSLAGQRDFTNLSGSIAGFLRPAPGWFLGLSLSRTSRAPTEEELFADGPHPATGIYERGDAGLAREVSYSVDASLHYNAGPWSLDAHGFAVRYDGFIDLLPTGLVDAGSGLPIQAFVQTKARFHGAEAEAAYRVWRDGPRQVRLEAAADTVRGDTDLGPPARIPPWSTTGRVVFEGEMWSARLELRQVGDQDRVAAGEIPTDSYRMVNASVSVRPFKDKDVKLFLDGRNLGDAEAREHASFLKDIAPLAGRSLRIGVAGSF